MWWDCSKGKNPKITELCEIMRLGDIVRYYVMLGDYIFDMIYIIYSIYIFYIQYDAKLCDYAIIRLGRSPQYCGRRANKTTWLVAPEAPFESETSRANLNPHRVLNTYVFRNVSWSYSSQSRLQTCERYPGPGSAPSGCAVWLREACLRRERNRRDEGNTSFTPNK